MAPTTENKIVSSPSTDAGNEEPASAVPKSSEHAAAEENTSENAELSIDIEGELADVAELADWKASTGTRVDLLDKQIDAIGENYRNFRGDTESENAFSKLSGHLIYEIKALFRDTVGLVEEMERVDEKVNEAESILNNLLGRTPILDEEWWIW